MQQQLSESKRKPSSQREHSQASEVSVKAKVTKKKTVHFMSTSDTPTPPSGNKSGLNNSDNNNNNNVSSLKNV
jgi:hypothetical protein